MKTLYNSFSMILFSVLAIIGVLMVLAFFDLTGVHNEPIIIRGTPINLPDFRAVMSFISEPRILETHDILEGKSGPEIYYPTPAFPRISQISPDNPILDHSQGSTSQSFTTREPTSTPVPPLDPAVYRTEVILRARNFASALETFLTANDRLGQDETLIDDPVWRSEISVILDQVVETGQALSAVGPPPPEYEAIQVWLERVGFESEGLRENYRKSLETRDSSGFSAAGNNLIHMKEDMSAAFSEMAKAGWPLE